jgi:uncharacterized protein YjgD (DUF1641 family)
MKGKDKSAESHLCLDFIRELAKRDMKAIEQTTAKLPEQMRKSAQQVIKAMKE